MKSDIRKRMKGLLSNQSEEERQRKSILIKNRLLGLPEYKNAKTILSYVSVSPEVSTTEFISFSLSEGKRILVPAVKGDTLTIHEIKNHGDLKPGYGGIPEPKDCSNCVSIGSVELAVVPGLAFDENGNRLGRGKGMFDRLFSKAGCARVALAFDFQVLESLPVMQHDVPVWVVITEKRTIRVRGVKAC